MFLFAFDLIELNGEDLRPAPLERRKGNGKLEKLLSRSDGIRFSEHLDGDGAIVFAHACKLGARRHRFEAPGPALPLRAMQRLDQDQEPGEPGRAAHHRAGRVVKIF